MELSDASPDHMNIRRGEGARGRSFYSFLQVPPMPFASAPALCCDCFGARELLASTPGAIEVACLGHCDLAPGDDRGDEIVPEGHHSTNEGPAVRLGSGECDARRLRARAARLLRALPSLEGIVEELKASGLTGYGGAGFPTA
jgi:hypothetical protein